MCRYGVVRVKILQYYCPLANLCHTLVFASRPGRIFYEFGTPVGLAPVCASVSLRYTRDKISV